MFGSPADLLGAIPKSVVAGPFLLQQSTVAGDYGKQIIEIVGYAARQAADPFHFLRLSQLFFHAQPAGDDAGSRNITDAMPQAVVNRRNRTLGMVKSAI